MATKTHSYGLRVRTSSSNGVKREASSSRPAESLSVPPLAATAVPGDTPSIKITSETRSSKTKTTAKRRSSSTHGKNPTLSSKSSKKRSMSKITTETKTTRRSDDISDMEDFPTSGYTFGVEETSSIQSSLLNWYDASHRVLPWRQNSHSRHQSSADNNGLSKGKKDKTQSPGNVLGPHQQRAYEVWISEMMLQQTRVDTVLLYYQKWMEKWPTLQDLALASLEDVYCVWAGLGYYRRARFLLEGAKQIMDKFSGTFPETVADLRNVRGIGQYTAGAIASIAFNRPVPLVDGNVVRVLCRLRAISESPKETKTVKLLWALAEELVDAKRPGDLNQALMELGATLCNMNPACPSCPIARHCHALSLASQKDDNTNLAVNSVKDFPVKVTKVPPRDEYVSVCVLEVSSSNATIQKPSDILLMQRPQKGLLAGLWEFPSVSLGKIPASAEDEKAAMDRYLKEHLGVDLFTKGLIQKRETLGSLRHLFSHIRWHLSVECLVLSPSGGLQKRITEFRRNGDPVKWIANDSVKELGLTTSVRKIYDMYLKRMEMPRREKSNK